MRDDLWGNIAAGLLVLLGELSYVGLVWGFWHTLRWLAGVASTTPG